MMHRRSFLAALGAGSVFAQTQLFWTVETTSGKVQGIANTGIKEFKGIPYGAPTGGKNRYMPPQKPASWTGVRECFGHGQICPQTLADLRSDYGMMIQWDLHTGRHGRGLPVAQRLDAGRQRRREARGHGLLPRRRIRHRLRQRRRLRRRATGQIRRRRGGHRQSSAGQFRLSASGRSGRAAGICHTPASPE